MRPVPALLPPAQRPVGAAGGHGVGAATDVHREAQRLLARPRDPRDLPQARDPEEAPLPRAALHCQPLPRRRLQVRHPCLRDGDELRPAAAIHTRRWARALRHGEVPAGHRPPQEEVRAHHELLHQQEAREVRRERGRELCVLRLEMVAQGLPTIPARGEGHRRRESLGGDQGHGGPHVLGVREQDLHAGQAAERRGQVL